MRIRLKVEFDVDPAVYADTYYVDLKQAMGEIPGHLVGAVRDSLSEMQAVGDRSTWIRSIDNPQEA